jgi:tetratricopeptide (TPR) repeat protein
MNAFNRLLSVSLWERSFTFRGRCLFVLLTLAPALLLSWEAGRTTTAMTLAASGDRDALERAVELDGSNPALEERLGANYLNGLGTTDTAAGLRHLRRAVELGPERALYWADVAAACESSTDFACADQAFARALRLAPMMPRLYWLAGNYRLRQSQPEAALPLFRSLLELSPRYAQPTFSICLRILNDPGLIEQALMPGGKDPTLRLAYADFLTAQGQPGPARQAWTDAVSQGSRFPFSLAKPYIDRLIDSGRVEQARSAWSDLEHLGVISATHGGNLVYNGSFEQSPLNAGFDWRYQESPYVAGDFRDGAARQGQRCLRLDFMGTNADFEPIFQWVSVASRQRYLLTAEARSERISSDSGPRLRVVDADCPVCLDVASDLAVGSTPWHQLSLEFTTGPHTRQLRLSIWRPRSRNFPTQISGQFWLDAVCLRAEPKIASWNP